MFQRMENFSSIVFYERDSGSVQITGPATGQRNLARLSFDMPGCEINCAEFFAGPICNPCPTRGGRDVSGRLLRYDAGLYSRPCGRAALPSDSRPGRRGRTVGEQDGQPRRSVRFPVRVRLETVISVPFPRMG